MYNLFFTYLILAIVPSTTGKTYLGMILFFYFFTKKRNTHTSRRDAKLNDLRDWQARVREQHNISVRFDVRAFVLIHIPI